MNSDRYYYEFIHGEFWLLLPDGEIQSFRDRHGMTEYVNDPFALFIEVTDQNRRQLDEEGAFDI